MFGLSVEKIALIALVAVFIIGPQRLPLYAAKLAKLVQTVRAGLDSAKERVAEEMGPEFQDVDWKKLDPRQYDPRRIVRTALLEEASAGIGLTTAAAPSGPRVMETDEESLNRALDEVDIPWRTAAAPPARVGRHGAEGLTLEPTVTPERTPGRHALPIADSDVA